jgi:hypothetical protein
MAARGLDVDELNKVKLDATEPRTVAVDEGAALREALPFQKGQVKPPPAPVTKKDDEPDPLGKTAEGAMMSPLIAQTLPFGKSVSDVDADESTALMPVPETDAAAPQDTPSAPGGPAVPQDTPSAPANPAGPTVPGIEPDAPTEAPPPSAGPRGPLSQPLPGMMAAQGPPPVPLPPHLEAMSVEHYAALCAECAVHPEWVASIHARYQIESDEQRTALDLRWRERFRVDDQLTQTWRWHYVRYQEWVKQQQG